PATKSPGHESAALPVAAPSLDIWNCARYSWRSLFMVPVICALVSAEVNAGTASAARMAIMAMTTNNSINVKAPTRRRCLNPESAEEFLFIFIGCGLRVAGVISWFTDKVNTNFSTFLTLFPGHHQGVHIGFPSGLHCIAGVCQNRGLREKERPQLLAEHRLPRLLFVRRGFRQRGRDQPLLLFFLSQRFTCRSYQAGGNENDQIAFDVLIYVTAEKASNQRQIADNRSAIFSFLHVFAHQSAQRHCLSIPNAYARRNLASAEHRLVNHVFGKRHRNGG